MDVINQPGTGKEKTMQKCQLCGDPITSKNNGFSDLLNNDEMKKVLKLRKDQTVCTDCKFTCMAVEILSPF